MLSNETSGNRVQTHNQTFQNLFPRTMEAEAPLLTPGMASAVLETI